MAGDVGRHRLPRGQSRRRSLAGLRAALILAALVTVFLGRPILHGGWFLPADITQIAGTRTVADSALSFQNLLETDPATQMDPWFKYDGEQISDGHIPTWNPYNALGTPQLANYISAVASPYSIPYYLFPLRWALLVAAAAKLWTLAFFTYLFLRRSRLSEGASLLGGIVYSFSGYHLLWLNWPQGAAAICLPAGAWACLVYLQAANARQRRLGLGAFALSLAASIYAGHPETLLFAVLGLGVVVAANTARTGLPWKSVVKKGSALLGASLLGLALGAFQLLPFLQYLDVSSNYANHLATGATAIGRAPDLSLLAFPDALGNPMSAYQEPSSLFVNYNEANGGYVGLLALGLALLGLFALRRPGPRRTLAASGLILATVGLALIHSGWFDRLVTKAPLLKLAMTSRSDDLAIFGLAVLAATGLDLLLRSFARTSPAIADRRPSRRFVSAGAMVVGGVAIFALADHRLHVLRHLQSAVPGSVTFSRAAVTLVHTQVEWVLLCCAIGLLAAVVIVLAPLRLRAWSVTAAITAILLAQFGLTGGMFSSYNPSVKATLVYPLTPAYQQAIDLTGQQLSFRDRTTFAFPETNLWWKTPELTSYDALGVKWYDDLFRATFHVDNAVFPDFGDEGMPSCASSLRLLGVRYVWTRLAYPVVAGPSVGTIGSTVDQRVPGLTFYRQVGDIRLFSVDGSTGTFSVVPTISPVRDDAAAVSTVAPCSFDPDSTAVVLQSGMGAVSATRASAALAAAAVSTVEPRPPTQVVQTLVDEPEHQRVAVSNGEGGELIARQTWFPGWKATVDGVAVPIDRVDDAMRGVALGPGSHIVDFRYQPAPVREGEALSLGALAATTLLVLSGFLVRGRHRRPAARRRLRYRRRDVS